MVLGIPLASPPFVEVLILHIRINGVLSEAPKGVDIIIDFVGGSVKQIFFVKTALLLMLQIQERIGSIIYRPWQ